MNDTPLAPPVARALVLSRSQPLSTEILPHARVLRRVLGQDVVSALDLPPFANSAMDGYAVRAEDLANAPRTLRVLETVGAGETATQEVIRGTCIKIMTGAPVPLGADCVVMREETREHGDHVEFLETAYAGQHVRPVGNDVRQGEIVFERGTFINGAVHAMLAALGQAQVEVYKRVRVAIVVTGKELVGVEEPLGKGQIRDSNSWALRGLVEECGGEVVAVYRTGDELEEVQSVLCAALADADVLVSSGGVSAGDFDPMRDILLSQAQVHFWKVAMKPGKPLMFASLYDKPVFALPGNPVSVMVAFEEFVRPALLKMAGRRAWKRIEVEARLEHDITSPEGRTEFVRARLELGEDGLVAVVSGDQNSGRLSTMARANALIEISPTVSFLPSGALVRAKLLGGPEVGGF